MHGRAVAVVEIGLGVVRGVLLLDLLLLLADGLDVRRGLVVARREACVELQGVQVAKVEPLVGCDS